jgi:DtxR family Mn-dependent transcriptional regulator
MSKLTKSREDYLRVLYKKINNKNIVKSNELAQELNISRSSVSRMMKILKKDGYIQMENYGPIRLTEKGKNYAKKIDYKHKTLYSFLNNVIGLDEKTANEEACHIEHIVSLKTVKRIRKLIDSYLAGSNKLLFKEKY